MRSAILSAAAAAALALPACDIAQQAAENQIRAEVSERIEATENAVRNGTDLDERYGNIANDVMGGEAAVRARAEREINERVGEAAISAMGRQ